METTASREETMHATEGPRRTYPRADLKWAVSMQTASGKMEGVTKDIGIRGAYICCTRPLRLNEVIDLAISAPDRSFKVNAEVVWSNVYGPDDKINPRGMGVRFLEMSRTDLEFITKALEDYGLEEVASEYLENLETEVRPN